MGITIRDILTLESAKEFTLVAGSKGLNRTVDVIDMMDFAWKMENKYASFYCDGRPAFAPNSFLLSSFQFADGNPELLYDTVERLINENVSGLAFKPVFFPRLPDKVMKLAESADFPIFKAEYVTTYREIIVDVTEAIRTSNNLNDVAEILNRFINEPIGYEEVTKLAFKISPNFKGNTRFTVVVPERNSEDFNCEQIIRSFKKYGEYSRKAILAKYEFGTRKAIIIMATSNSSKEEMFDTIVDNVLEICGLEKKNYVIASSGIHNTFSMLDRCMIEVKMLLTN
ncbi:MAG: PucR family transcriptional regulator ligand-binding domain-containing protein [Anaerovoracaceae bacterium]